MCGTVAQPSRDSTCGGGEAGRLGGAILLFHLGFRVHVIEHGEPAGPDHRSVLDPGDDRNALQNGARGWRGGGAIRGE
jgi:hypothetical protein